jgi:isoaspartyl peptidase/L-asparaginase-like protein (Ntn-hydrolase superfamily)
LPSNTGWSGIARSVFHGASYQQLLEARSAGMTQLDHTAPLDETTKMGTVGAVALDKAGNLRRQPRPAA